jgi:hypothetical protein
MAQRPEFGQPGPAGQGNDRDHIAVNLFEPDMNARLRRRSGRKCQYASIN